MSTPAGPYSIGSDHWPGLSKLVEETGELNQVLGKLLGNGGLAHHWDNTDLVERLHDELGDALAAMEFFMQYNGLDAHRIENRAAEKFRWFQTWHITQGALGSGSDVGN